MPNSIFNPQPTPPRKPHWRAYALILALTSAATAAMMLCPCDVVGLRDLHALAFVAIAALFTIAAAGAIYRTIIRDSTLTGFLRAVIALAIAGTSVLVELFLAQQITAWLAGR